LLKGNHLRISVRQDGTQPVMGIAFGMGEHFARIASKRPFHVAYKIEEEQWQGRSYLRMMVKDFWF
jgi:single-stranded-DNA-specific exonuclease